jgi:hypothetical protein
MYRRPVTQGAPTQGKPAVELGNEVKSSVATAIPPCEATTTEITDCGHLK